MHKSSWNVSVDEIKNVTTHITYVLFTPLYPRGGGGGVTYIFLLFIQWSCLPGGRIILVSIEVAMLAISL